MTEFHTIFSGRQPRQCVQVVQRLMSYCGQPYLIMLGVSALLCCYAAVHINNDDTVTPYADFKQRDILTKGCRSSLQQFHQSVAGVVHEDRKHYVGADCSLWQSSEAQLCGCPSSSSSCKLIRLSVCFGSSLKCVRANF